MHSTTFVSQRAASIKRLPGACCVLLLALLVSALPARGADPYVPPELAPWVDWVLHSHPNLQCPRNAQNGKPGRCVWVSNLSLDITRGAEFSLTARVFTASRVELPGDRRNWPVNVAVNNAPATVIGGNSSAALMLEPGVHTITGRINWIKRPTSLRLPSHTGLVALTLDGKPVVRPAREGRQLLLGNSQQSRTKAERNSIAVDVYRLVQDRYPLAMETTLLLQVAGQPRVETLGRLLLNDFEMVTFESDLPARLDPQGNLQIQVEAGTHELVMRARALGDLERLASGTRVGNWPEQEIWGFEPNRDRRLVNLSGAAPIDLSQTDAPFAEMGIQGYVLAADNALQFEVTQRGNPNPPPNRFQIRRDLWLNFDGDGYVVHDNLQAEITHASRLSANYSLGRVSVDGEDELINSLNGEAPGIELQSGSYSIRAMSDLAQDDIDSATGWQVDADSLQAELHLPPGWRLLWASGVDLAPQSWIAQWSLWKVFVLVLLGVLAVRFLSTAFAIALVVSGVLLMQSSSAMAVMWLIGVGLVAGVRHVSHAGALKWFRTLAWVWLGITSLGAISSAVTHARQAIYPQLEHHAAVPGYDSDYMHQKRHMPELQEPTDFRTGAFSAGVAEDVIEEVVVDRASARDKSIVLSSPKRKPKYAEGLQVQTGPATPNWRWNRVMLVWDGPVTANQTMQLRLLPPVVTRLINLLIAGALIGITGLLMLALLPVEQRNRLPRWLGRLAPLVLLTVALPQQDAWAETPGPELLKQLEERLLSPPDCVPGCASLVRIGISGDERSLSLDLSVQSATLVSLPLPGSSVWTPTSVQLNGTPASLAAPRPGALELALPAGEHRVQMRGPVSHLQRFELTLPLTPAQLDLRLSSAWQVTGLANGKVARGSLGFERTASATTQDETLKPAVAKPFVTIKRSLYFDQEWRMTTNVQRVAPASGGFSLQVPLLFDEAVLNQDIRVADGAAQLVFGRRDRRISWESRLEPRERLQLTAPEVTDRVEVWELVPSNFWHIEYSGLNPVSTQQNFAGPNFWPEAGEQLDVALTRTTPVPGATVTVKSIQHSIVVGARLQTHELTVNTLASQGGTLALTLADADNTLTSVTVDGRDEPLSLLGNTLPLPLAPGESNYRISWQESTPRSTLFQVAPPALEVPASNVSTSVEMSRDRWVLLLGGPALGPGILFWGLLLVVLLLAQFIARIPGIPFSATDAILLSLGLSLANLPATLLVAVWVISLRFRGNLLGSLQRDWTRNLLQLITAVLSVATIAALILSVPEALLGRPDMQVAGNGSSAYLYRWFTDQIDGALPSAWVLSVPLWIYRVIMLAWSLWLAFALIRWVPWAWEKWSSPQIWYSQKDRIAPFKEGPIPDVQEPQDEKSSD